MVGNLTNLNLSKGLLLAGKKALSSGLSVLEKLGPLGKGPLGRLAGTITKRYPIREVLMQ